MSFNINQFCLDWISNPTINPISKRAILSRNDPAFKAFRSKCIIHSVDDNKIKEEEFDFFFDSYPQSQNRKELQILFNKLEKKFPESLLRKIAEAGIPILPPEPAHALIIEEEEPEPQEEEEEEDENTDGEIDTDKAGGSGEVSFNGDDDDRKKGKDKGKKKQPQNPNQNQN